MTEEAVEATEPATAAATEPATDTPEASHGGPSRSQRPGPTRGRDRRRRHCRTRELSKKLLPRMVAGGRRMELDLGRCRTPQATTWHRHERSTDLWRRSPTKSAHGWPGPGRESGWMRRSTRSEPKCEPTTEITSPGTCREDRDKQAQPKRTRLGGLAEQHGLTAGTIPLVDVLQLQETDPESGEPRYEISRAYDTNFTPFAQLVMDRTYLSTRKTSIRGAILDTEFLYWKTRRAGRADSYPGGMPRAGGGGPEVARSPEVGRGRCAARRRSVYVTAGSHWARSTATTRTGK